MSVLIESLQTQLRADPEDDDSWRVYGDLLLGQGDPRGELISLELLAAEAPSAELTAQIRTLSAKIQEAWESTRGRPGSSYRWRRGFICTVIVDKIEKPEELASLAGLLADPEARFVTGMELSFGHSWLTKPDVLAGLEPLDLGGLRTLRAAYSGRGDRIVEALAERRALSLTSLDLRYSKLSDAGAATLAGCTQLSGLRALDLQHNELGPNAARALAEAGWSLERLDLRGNKIGAEGAEALAGAPGLAAIKDLYLYADDVEREGARALASSSSLPRDLARLWRAREQVQWRETN